MPTASAKRKGRPPKADKRPSTVVLAMRIPPTLYEEIRVEAEANGRSISAQAERRLIHREPEARDVSEMVGLAIQSVEKRADKRWRDDDNVKRRCRAAADLVLNILLGPALEPKAFKSSIEFEMSVLRDAASERPGIFTEVLAPHSAENIEKLFSSFQDWVEGRKAAEESFEALLDGKNEDADA